MFQTINRSRSTVNASRVAKKLHLSILLSPLLLLLLLLLLFSKFRAQSLHGQQDAGFTIKIITYNRLHSLQRLVSSISRARYEGPVDIEFHVEGGAPLELQKYVNSLSWSHGDARVHNRVVKGGLIQAVVESWEPVDQESSAIFLEDDIEVSPYFLNFLRAGIKILESSSLRIPKTSVVGISLYTPRLIESVNPKEKIRFDSLFPENLFLYQLPCSWGALYFSSHWRLFRDYMRHRLSMGDHVEVYGSTTNGWKASWKKFMIEYMWINDLFMLYPSYPGQLSFATNHLEPGEHITVNDSAHLAADFVVPLINSPPLIRVSNSTQGTLHMVDLFGVVEYQGVSRLWLESGEKQKCKHQRSWGKKVCDITDKETILFNLNQEKYTVLLSMFDLKRVDIVLRSISSLVKSEKLDKIIITWHSQSACPPSNAVINKKRILFLQSNRDSLNERFVPDMRIRTEAVLILDDDITLSNEDADGAFQAWKENSNKLVGYFPRWTKDENGVEYRYGSENLGGKYGGYRIMLTKGMFLHKKFLYEYFCGFGSLFHEFVDENMNGEDLAMNFVVSKMTGEPAGLYFDPQTPLGDYGKFLSSGLQKRNKHQDSRSRALRYFSSLTQIRLPPEKRIAKSIAGRIEYLYLTEVGTHHVDCNRTDFIQPCVFYSYVQ